MKRLRSSRPGPALIISIIALIVALGGTSYAAFKLPKNSVGSKQLKKNAVTTKKIKNGAVTAVKINTAGLTVANAAHANNADNAGTANNIAPPEGVRVIGAPGQPAFQNGCGDIPASSTPVQPVGFFKDKQGIVHLQGAFECPSASTIAFQLPAGYQPATGTLIIESASTASTSTAGSIFVVGPGAVSTVPGGSVLLNTTAADVSGVTFRPGA